MVSDRERRRLHDALAGVLGDEQAATVMQLLPPVGWGDVMRRSDATALRAEVTAVRANLEGQMAELRAEVNGQVAEIRAELIRLEGRVAGLVPKMVLANVGLAATVFGLTLAAARLA